MKNTEPYWMFRMTPMLVGLIIDIGLFSINLFIPNKNYPTITILLNIPSVTPVITI